MPMRPVSQIVAARCISSMIVGMVVPVSSVAKPLLSLSIPSLQSVSPSLRQILPDVVLEVFVGQVEARVDDLDDRWVALR